jgi:hypothetical protein
VSKLNESPTHKLPVSAEDVPGNDEATREDAAAVRERPSRSHAAEGNDKSQTESAPRRSRESQ